MMILKILRLLIVAILPLLFSSVSEAQKPTQLTDNLVRYLGFYVFNYSRGHPPGFEKVRWIRISKLPGQNIDDPSTNSEGYTHVDGYVETIDDERLNFKRARLKKNKDGNFQEFEFETEKIGNVSYHFVGNFLDRSVNEGGVYTDLRGNIVRYKNDDVVSSFQNIPLSKYAQM